MSFSAVTPTELPPFQFQTLVPSVFNTGELIAPFLKPVCAKLKSGTSTQSPPSVTCAQALGEWGGVNPCISTITTRRHRNLRWLLGWFIAAIRPTGERIWYRSWIKMTQYCHILIFKAARSIHIIITTDLEHEQVYWRNRIIAQYRESYNIVGYVLDFIYLNPKFLTNLEDHQLHFYILPSLDPIPPQVVRPIRNVLAFAMDEEHLSRPPYSPSDPQQRTEPVEFCVLKMTEVTLYSFGARLVKQRVSDCLSSIKRHAESTFRIFPIQTDTCTERDWGDLCVRPIKSCITW